MSEGPGPRRQAREAALQVLFAADATGGLEQDAVADTYERVLREFSLPQRARDRARSLVVGVASNCKSIDECIGRASERWRVSRLASVDRNVLRIATFELLYEPEIPVEVVIDEAVEIARRFASEGSPSFVNGVLDAIAHERGGAS